MTVSDDRPDDWDAIGRLTERVRRWGLLGIPTWMALASILFLAFPNIAGGTHLALVTLGTLVVVLVDDRMTAGDGRRLSRPVRLLVVWETAFVVLVAVMVSLWFSSRAALFFVPAVGALGVTGIVEVLRSRFEGRGSERT